jgi:hypothetical protein
MVTLRLLRTQKGFDANAKNADGDTPLHVALRNRAFLAVDEVIFFFFFFSLFFSVFFFFLKLLTGWGAGMYERNAKGETPGGVAAAKDVESHIQLLVVLKLSDFDEIAVLEKFPFAARSDALDAAYDWKKSTQVISFFFFFLFNYFFFKIKIYFYCKLTVIIKQINTLKIFLEII